MCNIQSERIKGVAYHRSEFRTKTNFLLAIMFDPSLEYIFDRYVVDKLITPVVLGMQWL